MGDGAFITPFVVIAFIIVSLVVVIIFHVENDRLKNENADIIKKNRILAQKNYRLESIKAEAEANLISSGDMARKAKEKAEQIIQAAENRVISIQKNIAEQAKILQAYKERIAAQPSVLQAYKEVVEGYSDKYIIPEQNFLDEYAEEYAFSDAGKYLAQARAETRKIIKQGKAVSWKSSGSKDALLANFLVDVFNGKVELIFDRIKKENFGMLTREITNAYVIVNEYGARIANIEISEPYLASRLEELKFGCVVFALRERDREEQKAIKEQMREEAKAQREQEKALKDAVRDEKLIREALEKARTQAEHASAEMKLKFQEMYDELQTRLADAEARMERTRSMAEQTKAGYIYIISNIGSFGEDVIKIGMSRRVDPMDRVRELGDASVPFAFDVHSMIFSKDAPKLELLLHHRFNHTRLNKVNYRKEFFRVNIADIKAVIDSLGIPAAFTLRAEAKQYRESLAIECSSQEERQKTLDRLIAEEDIGSDEVHAEVIEV